MLYADTDGGHQIARCRKGDCMYCDRCPNCRSGIKGCTRSRKGGYFKITRIRKTVVGKPPRRTRSKTKVKRRRNGAFAGGWG